MLHSTALMGYLSFVLFMIAHGLNMWLPYIFTALDGSASHPEIGQTPNLCQMLQRYQQSVSPVSNGNANTSAATTDEAACAATAASPVVYQLLLAYTGSCVLIFYAATLLMRHCDLRSILVVWFAVSAVAAAAFVWLPAVGDDGRSLTGVVLAAVLFLSCGNCGCIVAAVAQDLFPTRVRAMALCAIFALGRLGSVLGSWTLGAALMGAADDGGVVRCEVVFWLSAGALVSCAVLVGGCLPRTSAETTS